MTPLLALWAGLIMTADGPVTDVSIVPAAERTQIVISLEGEPDYRDFQMEGPHRIVVDVMGARHALPRESFPAVNRGGIRAVRASQYSPDVVRIVLELDEKMGYMVQQTEGRLQITLENPVGAFNPWSSSQEGSARTHRTLEQIEARANLSAARMPVQQQARRITVSFTQTPLEQVLFTFAEFANRSIVPGLAVTGNVSADIRDQPWDVALRSILEARNLVARETDEGIIRVDNIENLSAREEVEPVVTRPFRINFTTAGEIREAIEPLLSERGRISVGSGTNTVVITDLPRVMESVEELIEELDIRTPQVTISAKIIFVNRTALDEFGVAYELKDSRGNQLNVLSSGFADVTGDGEVEPVEQGTNVVSLSGASVAAMGNATTRVVGPSLSVLTSLLIGRHTLISFIDALESLNLSDIQAAPSLTVMDNQQARVLVGERTPIRVIDPGAVGQEGAFPQATVDFQETGIILDVTPHVTASDQVLLQLRAERSSVDLAEADVGFIFRTQEAESRVLVEDGETVVIAGLTVTERSQVLSGIPLLMDLPLLGRFFRVTRDSQVQRDLMILVTPHIVRESFN